MQTKHIEAVTPAFADYILESSELRLVETGFRFIEGPVWDERDQKLFFNDIKGNAIYLLDSTQGLRLFRDNSYLANGNTLDNAGNLITCEHGTSRVSMTTRDGDYSVLSSSYNGKALNSPNDVIVRSDGLILFTDPISGRGAGFGIPREPELDFMGVFSYDPKSGKTKLLVDDFSFPNGLCLSEDESQLYVNDTREQLIRVFDIDEAGNLSHGHLWVKFDEDLPGKADGLKIDSAGNIFSTGPGGILIYSPEAELIGRIYVPEQAANFCWGGSDLNKLYITASTTLYSIDLGVAGRA